MHRVSDPIDESSRLKQFAWEQWENQFIAVIFRYVNDRRKKEHQSKKTTTLSTKIKYFYMFSIVT
jgi:hypothetical protein